MPKGKTAWSQAATDTWALMSEVDINDRVAVTIGSPGGGGFAAKQFFVEGVHETYRPAGPDVDDVTLTLDLSPGRLLPGQPVRDEPVSTEAGPARPRPLPGGPDPIPCLIARPQRRTSTTVVLATSTCSPTGGSAKPPAPPGPTRPASARPPT